MGAGTGSFPVFPLVCESVARRLRRPLLCGRFPCWSHNVKLVVDCNIRDLRILTHCQWRPKSYGHSSEKFGISMGGCCCCSSRVLPDRTRSSSPGNRHSGLLGLNSLLSLERGIYADTAIFILLRTVLATLSSRTTVSAGVPTRLGLRVLAREVLIAGRISSPSPQLQTVTTTSNIDTPVITTTRVFHYPLSPGTNLRTYRLSSK